MTAYFRWLSHTHAMRWHVAHNTVGRGHLYQGRFKTFPVEEDDHFYHLCRYVERNAINAGVVDAGGGLALGKPVGVASGRRAARSAAERLAFIRPRNWTALVNQPLSDEETERVQISIARNRPLGERIWQATQAKRLA